ncbi:MAG: hypothetical protein IJA61_02495 [Clostridia bacterium]|nr:hypothetical protein [Clostridia bacterium]
MNKYRALSIASLLVAALSGINLIGSIISIDKANEKSHEICSELAEKYQDIKSSTKYQEFYAEKAIKLSEAVQTGTLSSESMDYELKRIGSNEYIKDQYVDTDTKAELTNLENAKVELSKDSENIAASILGSFFLGSAASGASAVLAAKAKDEEYMCCGGGFKE